MKKTKKPSDLRQVRRKDLIIDSALAALALIAGAVIVLFISWILI